MANDLNFLLKTFKQNRFDPNADSETTILDQAGNYIICLKLNSKFPIVPITPTLTSFNGLKVIYTGIASGSLRSRDYRQHFKGNNAGRSTLRKSLGVLFGYKLIPRDKDPSNGKTKFGETDEQKLSDWMSQNLLMFFLPATDFADIEKALINHFNPPLNLKDNHNSINADFRKLLSNLRSGHPSVKTQATTTTTVKATAKKNTTPTKTTSKKPKTTDIVKIIEAIDGKLLKTGKHYLLLGQANQLLLSKRLIKDNKVLKQMLEGNEIPYAQQTDGVVKQWRIPLSKAGEQKRKAIERRAINAKKAIQKKIADKKATTKRESFVQEETSLLKIFLYIVAVCFLFGACNELTKTDTTEFNGGLFLFTLIGGIIIFTKAKSIKPIIRTIYYPIGTTQYYYENDNINTQNNYGVPIMNTHTVSTRDKKQKIDEDEIYGLASDFAGDGIEDEIRDYLDNEREERHDYHSRDREIDRDY